VTAPDPGAGAFNTVGLLGLPNLNFIQGFDISGLTGTAYAVIGTPPLTSSVHSTRSHIKHPGL
jgi:hypothetical protein